MILSIPEHLKAAKERIIPPHVLEVVLRSGRSYFVKWIFGFDEYDETVTLRIWDMRLLTPDDQKQLLARMNEMGERADYSNVKSVHPKLDHANLHVPIAEIEALVEWRHRIWPIGDDESKEEPRPIGFHSLPR